VAQTAFADGLPPEPLARRKLNRAMGIQAIDHIQLAMPVGGEDAARSFYGGLLGLNEMIKPPELAKRGGVWFKGGAATVHVGVEDDFRPARKAHPAFLVQGLAEILDHLRRAGVEVIDDDLLPGYERAYVADPFGNRIELMEPSR